MMRSYKRQSEWHGGGEIFDLVGFWMRKKIVQYMTITKPSEITPGARTSSGSVGLGVRQDEGGGWWEAQDGGRHPSPRSFLARPRD
ncbi:hypothetical protein E2C01_004013 [Portunus trituberculatus]|uniref:Uncharacterized protein n=1 Tax=Portunus trituberculatus TaxID=210409 RepID=A0A5B7CPE1_PORTR|nr:hypothetical protein [Portunus trituberculatus]